MIVAKVRIARWRFENVPRRLLPAFSLAKWVAGTSFVMPLRGRRFESARPISHGEIDDGPRYSTPRVVNVAPGFGPGVRVLDLLQNRIYVKMPRYVRILLVDCCPLRKELVDPLELVRRDPVLLGAQFVVYGIPDLPDETGQCIVGEILPF